MRIGIIQARPGIGDMCIFLPFIHFISKHFGTKVYLFTKNRTRARDMLKYDPFIVDVIYIDSEKTNKNLYLFNEIKKKKLDQIFIFHFGIRYWLICFFVGIKNISYYGWVKKRVGISDFIKLKISKWLKINDFKYECKIYYPEKKNHPSVVVGIGGSGNNKKWDINKYIELIKILKEKNIDSFVIAGGPEETIDFEKIKKSISDIKLINLCDKNIGNAIDFIAGSKFYVGNDTGFMHICASLNIPSYGIFGDTPTDYAKYNDLIIAIMPPGYDKVEQHDKLMHAINPEHIINVLQKNNIIN